MGAFAIELTCCDTRQGAAPDPASVRRQPAHIEEGQREGGYTGAFELICCECGDHPYLDYSEISPRLQRIRGPYTMRAGLAAYKKHLGLISC